MQLTKKQNNLDSHLNRSVLVAPPAGLEYPRALPRVARSPLHQINSHAPASFARSAGRAHCSKAYRWFNATLKIKNENHALRDSHFLEEPNGLDVINFYVEINNSSTSVLWHNVYTYILFSLFFSNKNIFFFE